MGEVYLAQDTRLDRRVAIKFLPAQFCSDKDFKARFKREAQAAAKLDHPNIVTVHEVGEFQGRPYFVMQYVEGKSLHHYCHDEPLPLNKVIDLAIQMCEGLGKAHHMGIIHRDIKSTNVLVDLERRPKILDFGLATIQGGDRLTKVGSTIGTVAYMSPEQAMGKEVDARSDLFSMGVVLYELIAARTPFKRDNDAATLKAITQDTPEPLSRYRANVPDELQRIITKLLERDPDLRYQTASGVISDLKKLAVSGSSGIVQIVPQKTNRALIGIAVAAVIVLMAVVFWVIRRSSTNAPSSEFSLNLTSITDNGKTYSSAISPDGKYVVYAELVGDKGSLSVRQVATGSVVQILPPTDANPGMVSFTPDGNYVCYSATNKSGGRSLYQLPALGGTPKVIVSDVAGGAAWSPDGKQLAFTRVYQKTGDYTLLTLDPANGIERKLITGRGVFWYYGTPSWSSDGKLIAVCKGMSKPKYLSAIAVIRVIDGAEIWTTSGDSLACDFPIWDRDGQGINFCAEEKGRYANAQILHVTYPKNEVTQVTRDLANYSNLTLTADNSVISAIHLEVHLGLWLRPDGDSSGEPKQITSGRLDGSSGMAWMPDGSILYTSRTSRGISLWNVNADGSGSRELIAGSPLAYSPRVTPDGKYIVFVSDQAGEPSIWRADINGQNMKQLTFGEEDYRPSISPDSKWIVFETWRNGPDNIAKISIDGGDPQILSDQFRAGPSFSPDGKWIAYFFADQGKAARLGLMSFDGSQPDKTLDWPTGANTGPVIWCPGGTEVYYVKNQNEIGNVWSLSLSDGKSKQITKFTTYYIENLAWSSDHKSLVLSRGTASRDAVLFSGYK